MKINIRLFGFLILVLCTGVRVLCQETSGRYKILSTTTGQYAETYMLDAQSGRVWMMRGQVSQSPALVPCVYQLSISNMVLSPDQETQIVPTNDRFSIKSATSGQYAETYILDRRSGKVWAMRGQVSSTPSLIPCFYQLSNGETALTPTVGDSANVNNRFSITCAASDKYAETYVNDTQNGGVWMMRGQVSQGPFLIPCAYQLADGESAQFPMDTQSEIRLLQNKLNPNGAVQGSQMRLGDTSQLSPQKLPPDVQRKLDDVSKKMDDDMKKLFPQ